MRYGVWSGEKERFPRAFYERAYHRQSLAAWDDKWHRLSDQARNFFLNVVKGPAKPPANEFDQLSVPIDKLPPHILKELTTAGFVEVQRAKSQAYTDRVIACGGLYDFATRVRTLQRVHLLAADKPSEFTNYVEYVFFSDQLIGVLIRMLRTVGIQDYFQVGEMLKRYVMNYRWPRWAARELQEPLADRILDVVQEADGPVLLADLLGRIKGSSPDCGPVGRGQTGHPSGTGRGRKARNLGIDGRLPPRRSRWLDPRQQASRTSAAPGVRTPQGDRTAREARSSTTFAPSSSKSRVSRRASVKTRPCSRRRSSDFKPLWNPLRRG